MVFLVCLCHITFLIMSEKYLSPHSSHCLCCIPYPRMTVAKLYVVKVKYLPSTWHSGAQTGHTEHQKTSKSYCLWCHLQHRMKSAKRSYHIRGYDDCTRTDLLFNCSGVLTCSGGQILNPLNPTLLLESASQV
jgi:hypothetical protein